MSDPSWVTKFKLAVANEDLQAIEELADSFKDSNLENENLEVKLEARALIQTATMIITQKKEKLDLEFKKLQKAKKYVY